MSAMKRIVDKVSALNTVVPKMVTDDGIEALDRLCDQLGLDLPNGYYMGAHGTVCFITPFFTATKEVADEIRFRLNHIGELDIYSPDFWEDVTRLVQEFLNGIIY